MPSQLQIVQLHARRPAEQADRDLHLALVGQHFFDGPAEVGERPLGDLHHLANQEGDLLLRFRLRHRLGDAEETVHFILPERLRKAAGSHKLDNALNAVNDVQALLIHRHLDEHVTGIELPLYGHLLAVLDLDDLLHRHQRLTDQPLLLGPRVLRDALGQKTADLVLVTGGGLDRVPAVLHGHRHLPSLAPPVTRIQLNRRSIHPMASPRTTARIRIIRVALDNSSRVGQVTFLSSAFTERRKSTDWPIHRAGCAGPLATCSTTWIPCGARSCASCARTSSTLPARGASAGSCPENNSDSYSRCIP